LLKTGDVLLEFELLLMALPGLFIGEWVDFSEEELDDKDASGIVKWNLSLPLFFDCESSFTELEWEVTDLFVGQSLFEFFGMRTNNWGELFERDLSANFLGFSVLSFEGKKSSSEEKVTLRDGSGDVDAEVDVLFVGFMMNKWKNLKINVNEKIKKIFIKKSY
jgi:hypothetical protein